MTNRPEATSPGSFGVELSQLASASGVIAAQEHAPMEIRDLYQSTDPTQQACSKYCRIQNLFDAQSVKAYIAAPQHKGYHTRIISMCKEHSWAPLDAGEDMLSEMMAVQNIMPEFWQVITSFRSHASRLEEAFSDCVWKQRRDGVCEITYVLKYPEIKEDGDRKQWSIRQTGVYQQYNPASKQNAWVLIFPNYESITRKDLIKSLNLDFQHQVALDHPLQIHLFLFRARMENWRAYMSHFEKEVWELSNLALTVNIGDKLAFGDMYRDLSSLHYIEMRLSPLPSIFAAQREIASKLVCLDREFREDEVISGEEAVQVQEHLQNLKSRINAYEKNAKFILSRIRSTVQLVSDTISLKSQNTSEEMSDRMLDLNKSTAEDSTTMRVITLVTLVYLPSSFVGVEGFFGMAFFFTSDEDGTHWIMAPYIWVYFAISVPLTVLTVAWWRWKSRRAAQSRATRLVEVA